MKLSIKLSFVILAMSLTACNSDTIDTVDTEKRTIVACNETSTSWEDVTFGDQVAPVSEEAVIKISHTVDGSKKVCVVTGTAEAI